MSRFHYSKAYSAWGASMGRKNDALNQFDPDLPKLRLQRVPPRYGGDYDPGGAYWGGIYGANALWCAENADGLRIYVRAPSRSDAKVKVTQMLSPYLNARFYK